MPTVAEQLRAGREAKKLTIPQVAEATKIRTDHIRALEEGNFNVFSAPVYIRGFVRNYATHLKLDVPQVMAALDAELGRTEKFNEPPPLVEESKTAARPRNVLARPAELASRSRRPRRRGNCFNWRCSPAWRGGITCAVIRPSTCRPPFINPPIPVKRCRCRSGDGARAACPRVLRTAFQLADEPSALQPHTSLK